MAKQYMLLDEYPLIVLPSLAVKIGLNEAIFLQQLNYLLQHSKNLYDDRKWVYNSYKQWQEMFPFFSNVTVRRNIESLEKKGLIISGNYNKLKMDKTKWYTIDYDVFDALDAVDNSEENSVD